QLKDNNLYDDTLIIFLSDHGDFTGDYNLVEKTQNTFQDCLTNVPLIIKPPKSENTLNGVSDTMIELIDIAGTIYDYSNIDPSYWHFGKSIKNFIEQKTDNHREEVFTEGGRLRLERQASESQSLNLPHGLYYPRVSLQGKEDEILMHTKATMCRNKKFKYIKRAYEKDELYNLINDPGEINNVIDDHQYASELKNLKEKMLSWYQETCDVVPLKSDERNF
ncbi:sulfatase-like hydrolase/transferase, partial [Pelagibacteraceae bacterium]|nr:sulfatase-like hydrolase/transferase [Pelagibacteraceae bacterium]